MNNVVDANFNTVVNVKIANVLKAISDLKIGRSIIIVDDNGRENEGDLVASCENVTLPTIDFMIKHSSGILCMATTSNQIQKLGLDKLVSKNHKRDNFETAFTMSIEASSGISTGVSAMDRLRTLKVASKLDAKMDDVVCPGHVFPLQARDGLLDERKGHTEASVEICKLAAVGESAVIAELPSLYGGKMMRGEELDFFAKTYNLTVISVNDILEYKESLKSYVCYKYSEAKLPTEFGNFMISIYLNDKKEELTVLSMGDINGADFVPVRLHSKCLTGDSFHSIKCDCKYQLHSAMEYIAKKGVGAILYLDQEGRGIGLAEKIKAYSMQDKGMDTIEANLAINMPVDARTFDFAIAVLKQLNLKSVELITNNPKKLDSLKSIFTNDSIRMYNIVAGVTNENKDYLDVKKSKMNHKLKF